MQNLVSRDWKKTASEMRCVAEMNRTKKPVYHHISSFSPDEKLSDEQMFQAAALMLEKLGLADHQALSAVHRDRDHLHVHTVVNLVNFDGRAEKLSHDFRSRPVHAREIEKELGLQAYSRKEQTMNRMADERAQEIKSVLSSSRSTNDLRRRLEQIGVSLEEKSSRAKAINFRLLDTRSGAQIAGSRIDPALSSPSSLKKYFSRAGTTAESAEVQRVEATSKATWNENKNANIQHAAATSKNWDDLRENLQSQGFDFEIITRANGAKGVVFVDQDGHRVAGSKVASSLSYGRLEKQFSAHAGKARMTPWEEYAQARSDHYLAVDKTPEALKAEAAKIKADRERLWRDYKARTALIPQCFSPRYRRTMREAERQGLDRALRRLDHQAEALRQKRFPSFQAWKDGAAAPVIQPKQSLQSLWQKVRDFFQPIAGSAEHYHRSHTYQPKPPPLTAPPQLRPVAATTSGSSDANFYALMNSPSILRASAALEAALRRHSPAPAPAPARSNEHARRNNDHQR